MQASNGSQLSPSGGSVCKVYAQDSQLAQDSARHREDTTRPQAKVRKAQEGYMRPPVTFSLSTCTGLLC